MIKARQGGAPVYTYMFAWESPVLDGILRSTHCMEIPFVFNNADIHASMTGGGKDALELAENEPGMDQFRPHRRPEYKRSSAVAGLQLFRRGCHDLQ